MARGRSGLAHLVLSELADDGLVQEEADVFEQVEGPLGRGALVDLLLVFGFMWVNSLQDAQSSTQIE